MQDTKQIIVEAIADEIGCEAIEVTPLKKLEDLGADSLDVCEIGIRLEEAFDLRSELEFQTETTVQEVFDSVEKLVPHKR